MVQVFCEETDDFHAEKDLATFHMSMMHYHHAFEIYYLCHGEREYFIGDEFYKVTDGDLVFIPQNVLHRTSGKGALRFLIYFSEGFLARFFTPQMLAALPLDRPTVFHPDEGLGQLIEAELGSMVKRFEETRTADAASAASIGYLLTLLREKRNHYAPEVYTDRRIGEIVRYINEHYAEIEDIEDVAGKFYVSKYHLCRIFNKNLGLPLISYLNTIKIRAAAELMHNKDLSLTEIALRCGFNSSSYFCKVFKSEKGVSPSEYRKRLKGK